MAADGTRTLEVRPRRLNTVLETSDETKIDIVAVPAIGADPNKTWTGKGSNEPWLITESKEMLSETRVMFLDHGIPAEGESLDSLAGQFLDLLRGTRTHDKIGRPLFFVCHSTGGLVAKAALVLDSKAEKPMISPDCFGIAFMSTPHQGSSYLWASEFTDSIRTRMNLMNDIPNSLRNQFRPMNPYLWNLSQEFKSISEDMRIWTFLETADSILQTREENGSLEIRVPITSIISGVLDLDHESKIPLESNHMGTACFGEPRNPGNLDDLYDSENPENPDRKAMKKFMEELKSASRKAKELSDLPYTPMDVKKLVDVQVNGFFEDTARGISDETPLKLWSAPVNLTDYLTKGPVVCLNERIQKVPRSVDGSPYTRHDAERSSSTEPLHREESRETSNPPRGRRTERNGSSLSVTPPLRRSRSSMRPAVPRIHVTGPQIQLPSASEVRMVSSLQMYPNQIQGIFPDLSRDRAYQRYQRHVTATRSSYNGFLALPQSTGDQLDENFTEAPPQTAPTFDKPDPGTERLIWIHVPYTHTGWVPDIISKAFVDSLGEDLSNHLINDDNWYLHLLRARHLKPHARFVKPSCIYFGGNSTASPSPSSSGANSNPLALYLPYLHWDTYRNIVHRRDLIKRRLHQGRTHPVPRDILKGSVEEKMIWKYLSCEPPIHVRRTLDQFGYPHLRSTVSRDDDQMLWKRTRKLEDLIDWLTSDDELPPMSNSPDSIVDGKVLMVDQIWLWVLDQKTVVTFFPKQEGSSSEEKLYAQSNLYSSIYNELNGDLAARFETAGDLAALIALHAVTVLFDKTVYHDLQVLQIFEESISILTEWVTKSFKHFRSQGFHSSPMTSRAQREAKDRKMAKQNQRDVCTLLELRDIVDELGTISKLLDQQVTTITVMNSYYKNESYGKLFIGIALLRLDDYRAQVSEMVKDANTAKQAVKNLLDLKQKQANVDESRLARWQAEVTQNQSRAVMIFTVFTVIFLPLSFFTSLFGINVREWSGESTNLTMREMLAIAGPTSVAIIIVALALAFSKIIRDAVVKTQTSVGRFVKDFVITPVQNMSQKENGTDEVQTEDSLRSPRTKKRLRRYTLEGTEDGWPVSPGRESF